jgi:hypothetical protein
VIEVISTEVNIILAKIESLYETTSKETSIEPKWTEIVTGRHKRDTNGRHKNIYRIPVIKIDTNYPVIVKPMKSRYLIQPRIKK